MRMQTFILIAQLIWIDGFISLLHHQRRFYIFHCFQNVYTRYPISFLWFDFMHCLDLFSRVYIGKRIATASTSSYWKKEEAVPGCSPVSKTLNHPPVVKLSLCIYCTPTFLLPVSIKFCHIVDVAIKLYTWCNVVALHHILTHCTQQLPPTWIQ